MKKMVVLLACLAFIPGIAVRADDDCFVPMAEWQTRQSVARFAADKGWSVRHIKIDDGCYEIKGTDLDGRRIEVTVHPGTLEVIEIEYEDDDHHRHDQKKQNPD